jgi:crossover junction endodeoxyribonuclease RuvC
MTEKIILGIDPGTQVMGYGLIKVTNNKTVKLLTFGIKKLSIKENQGYRLKEIFDFVTEIIQQYNPDEMSLEAPFFGKNVQSMLKLGRAQGVCMAAAIRFGMPVEEYTPKRVKQSITGSGNASKEQVAAMLKQILKFKEMPKYLDATDGLAVAYCHYLSKGKGELNKSSTSSWKSFLSDNPKRLG